MDDQQFEPVIGQAVELLMEKYGLDPDGAFDFLLRAAAQLNTMVREVALWTVKQHEAEAEGRNTLA